MLSTAAAAIANRLLEGQPWLQQRLLPFPEKTLALRAGPFVLALRVGADGALHPGAEGAPADAFATLSPTHVVDLVTLQGRPRAVDVQGDAAFAAAVAGVLSELRWDAEEDLSRLVGDIAAHRLAGAVQAFVEWQRNAALSLAATAAEFFTEEQPVLASRAAVDQFIRDVDDLRDALERLEKRFARLARR